MLHWNGVEQWLWAGGLIPVRDKRTDVGYIDRMTPGDMPAFDPGLQMAATAFRKLTDAAVKHMIVISDGDPAAPTQPVINALKAAKITVTTVAVGCHGQPGNPELERLALQTRGQILHRAKPPGAAEDFQRKARRVAQPLVYEDPKGFQPRLKYPHEITSGISTLPPITGFVLYHDQEKPAGRVGHRFARAGRRSQRDHPGRLDFRLGPRRGFHYRRWRTLGQGLGQLGRLRQVLQPAGAVVDAPRKRSGKIHRRHRGRGGQGQSLRYGADQDDEFLNFLDMAGNVIGPDVEPRS